MFNKLNNIELSEKNNIEYLQKLRILKKNLVHIHGIPKSLVKDDLLKSEEYLGQYGTIVKFLYYHLKQIKILIKKHIRPM